MKLVMNDTRKAIVNVLKEVNAPMTLAEIGEKMGATVKTGTTNAMVAAGVIRKVGTRKVTKTVTVEVATYEMGEMPKEEEKPTK